MNWEKVFYEVRPLLYLVLGGLAIFYRQTSKIFIVVGILFLLFGSVVFSQRLAARSAEKFFYDIRPFIYVFLSILSLFYFNESSLGIGSALLLLFCSSMIVRWRNKA